MNEKIDWLQALRGIAALMVVLFHMVPHLENSPLLSPLAAPMKYGFSGVDVFFALSGFVIYRSSMQIAGLANIGHFIKRRAMRIFFGYWPALAFTAIIWHLLMGIAWPGLGKALGSALLIFPNLLDNWLPTAWSLTYELYFYALMCLVLLAAPTKRLLALAGLVMLLVLWNSLWLLLDGARVVHGHQPLRFLLTGFAVEFFAGALIAHLHNRLLPQWSGALAMLMLLSCLALLGFTAGTTSILFANVEILRACTYGVFAIGMLLLALSLHESHIPAPAWLVKVGDASFSLYLLHPVLIDILASFNAKHLPKSASVSLLFFLALPVLIAFISVHWSQRIEMPLFRWSTRTKSKGSI